MESRSLLKVITRRLCSLLLWPPPSPLCVFITLGWLLNVWTCRDSFALRPGRPLTSEEWTNLETKTESFCAGQRENICPGWRLRRRRLVFGLTLWREEADGNMTRATVCFIITIPNPPYVVHQFSPCLSARQKKENREFLVLLTSPQELMLTVTLSFFDEIEAQKYMI